MERRIITGHDGSAASLAALEWAAGEALLRHADLCIVAAHQVPPHIGAGLEAPTAAITSVDVTAGLLEVDLDRAAHGIRLGHPGLTVCTEVIADSPRHALVARSDGADLLVIGASGAGSITGWVFGSVVQHAIRHSPCPVVVVPGGSARRPSRRVVVGIDGSAAADGAVDWAADEADRRSLPLEVIHGWERPFAADPALTADVHALAEVDAATTLDAAVARARERCGAPVQGRLIEGNVVDALLASGAGSAVLVVGSAGRGGFRSMLVGSVAQAVAEHAPCPVVVVRRGAHAPA